MSDGESFGGKFKRKATTRLSGIISLPNTDRIGIHGLKQAEITLEDLVVTETPKSGWSVSSHSGESVALDLELTPELILAGLVREVIRAIQEERKNSGLDISDRILVEWNAPESVASAIAFGEKEISEEVLAVSFTQNSTLTAASNDLGLSLNLIKQ